MPRFPTLLALCAFIVFQPSAQAAGENRKLTLADGDRVLLIGDVLIERENNYGLIETKMRQEFPGKKFSVRNLGYSGDTPLGASRASFDPVAKGLDRLKEQLEVVKPTVAVIGYGMAASLEELTYRKNDPALNPDPARYGTEHTPARLKREVAQLMELITQNSPGGKVRFVILGPIQHEDLRGSRPGLPDPSEHNQLLAAYEIALSELAAEKGAAFLKSGWKTQAGITLDHGTDNGIHLTEQGYRALSEGLAAQLGWNVNKDGWDKPSVSTEALRASILRKNSLFFHRSRPANYTYIFGFRSREQGRNAVEIPKFDPLIDKAEADVVAISNGQPSTLAPEPKSTSKLNVLPPLPAPEFQLSDGLKMTLFAENPLLEKPVHMNWDTAGRLWVATSNTYPQVNPEDLAAQMTGDASKFGPSTGNDKIILLEDTKHTGVADTSRIIADHLLIPSGVAPDNLGGCFVGASTELLHLTQPNADGILAQRRIVLSGFGTEDTHHIVHTLHWGIDGRLYFHQTIYIHSHLETPWGLVRANSGVAFAYDPNTERLEVHSKGLVNAWGQQEDLNGQTFLTSGADGTGVHWAFPGATFPPSEGARRLVGSISPGSYPKFSGLELIQSPLFSADWQGNAITCDFRAHRIVRFGFNDFTADSAPKSGYVTKELPDVVRTSDVSFRPITPKMGPDGALYVADWSNPIINHGEVDFRDPRRDKLHGRIWRIAPQASTPLIWEPLTGKPVTELLAKLRSPNRWDFEQARRELAKLPVAEVQSALSKWTKDEVTRRHAAWLLSGRTDDTAHLATLLKSTDTVSIQVGLRELGKSLGARSEKDIALIVPFLTHANPRVQLEAHRALARIRTPESAAAVLGNLPKNPEDTFLDFAAWTSVNELARPWLEDVAAHPEKINGQEASLDAIVKAIDPGIATPYVQRLFVGRQIDAAGSGPWIELIGKAGTPAEATLLFASFINKDTLQPAARLRAAKALFEAATRNVLPSGDLASVGALLNDKTERELLLACVRLAGQWKQVQAVPAIGAFAGRENDGALRVTAVAALRTIGQKPSLDALRSLTNQSRPAAVRQSALPAFAAHAPGEAMKALPSIFAQIKTKEAALQVWTPLLQTGGFPQRLANNFPKELSPHCLAAALQAARSLGRGGQALVKTIEPLTGAASSTRNFTAEIAGMIANIQKGADPADGEIHYRKAGCTLCHAIGGAGGKLGPDLSSLGASAPLDYIIESVLNPAAKVKEGYHAFSFKMKDGAVMTGIPARETATELFIRPGPGVELPILKANILSRDNIGSIMPAGLIDALDFVPRRNLLAFLGEIGKPGAFDASKSNVARLWVFDDQPPGALAKSAAPTPVYTLINGQLPKEFNPGRLYASARFTTASNSSKPLVLTGVKAAWLDDKAISLKNGQSNFAISAGNHVLTVEVDGASPYFKAQCDDASFLGDK
ncbi:MAG: HEAT repeat domain-containing protein [Verrucomicrobiota bacterium]|jgi:putative heme-binding domain-containing protein